MRLIACHDGKLLTLDSTVTGPAGAGPFGKLGAGRSFSSGLADLDAIAPGGAFARGAIHELLTDPADGKAMFLAMLLITEKGDSNSFSAPSVSQSSLRDSLVQIREDSRRFVDPPLVRISDFELRNSSGAIIWCDPARELYPPALAAHGFPLDRLFLLHPTTPDPHGKDMIWAATECLRCKGVAAVVAAPGRLSRIEARRLQLAAERGGGVGILLRHTGRDSAQHASATRWLVRPAPALSLSKAPGSRTTQRWTIQLLHGHGGRVGQTLCLEHCRETNHLHTFDPMADRQVAKVVTKAS